LRRRFSVAHDPGSSPGTRRFRKTAKPRIKCGAGFSGSCSREPAPPRFDVAQRCGPPSDLTLRRTGATPYRSASERTPWGMSPNDRSCSLVTRPASAWRSSSGPRSRRLRAKGGSASPPWCCASTAHVSAGTCPRPCGPSCSTTIEAVPPNRCSRPGATRRRNSWRTGRGRSARRGSAAARRWTVRRRRSSRAGGSLRLRQHPIR
jgi:hypothetical protein